MLSEEKSVRKFAILEALCEGCVNRITSQNESSVPARLYPFACDTLPCLMVSRGEKIAGGVRVLFLRKRTSFIGRG